MVIDIDSPEAERLARELAEETGESLNEAVTVALRDRLTRVRSRSSGAVLHAEIARIQAFVASLPDRDSRSDHQIIGYDEHGIPR